LTDLGASPNLPGSLHFPVLRCQERLLLAGTSRAVILRARILLAATLRAKTLLAATLRAGTLLAATIREAHCHAVHG
jgi:hypothetical protein